MRYLRDAILKDLKKKLVLLGGPRQVGKTTLALGLLGKTDAPAPELREHPAYLNWDVPHSKSRILHAEIPGDEPLIVLDEIHKYRRWRSLLKGLFDQYQGRKSFLITGSARLDHYRFGGESLLGRYHYLRLHPFSLRELAGDVAPTAEHLKRLLEFGGFPEPLLSGDHVLLRRWQQERNQHVIEEDLRDLEHVQDISRLHLLIDALPARVGSPLSIQNLSQQLEIPHPTLKRYLEIFENLYVSFRIPPYGSPKIRAVKKEQKLYLWDWSQIEEEGFRFENLVASQLLKYCDYITDTLGHRMELRYIRDTDSREIDFVVLRDRKPEFAVEAKTGEKSLSKHIAYFKVRTPIPRFYQVHLGIKDFGDALSTGRVLPFSRFCEELKMP